MPNNKNNKKQKPQHYSNKELYASLLKSTDNNNNNDDYNDVVIDIPNLNTDAIKSALANPTKDNNNYLYELSFELINMVFSFLKLEDLMQFRITNKLALQLVDTHIQFNHFHFSKIISQNDLSHVKHYKAMKMTDIFDFLKSYHHLNQQLTHTNNSYLQVDKQVTRAKQFEELSFVLVLLFLASAVVLLVVGCISLLNIQSDKSHMKQWQGNLDECLAHGDTTDNANRCDYERGQLSYALDAYRGDIKYRDRLFSSMGGAIGLFGIALFSNIKASKHEVVMRQKKSDLLDSYPEETRIQTQINHDRIVENTSSNIIQEYQRLKN